jgi:integrase
LARYARRRDRLCPRPHEPAFFLSCRGKRLDKTAIQVSFKKLRHAIGLKERGNRRGPGTHALRHRFVVTTLLRGYRRGADVERLIPLLSTYLGHTLVSCTYWYLSAAPELMRLAGARLEKTLGGLP